MVYVPLGSGECYHEVEGCKGASMVKMPRNQAEMLGFVACPTCCDDTRGSETTVRRVGD